MAYSLICASCKAGYGSDEVRFRCKRCGSVLEVAYHYTTLKLPIDFKKRPIKQVKYEPFFPGKIASLNEGGTRLIKAKNLSDSEANLYLKMESENPTNSFKDRGSSVEIGKALELGFDCVCSATTGNMGFSVATYAKHRKLKSVIFISKDANQEKMKLIEKAGAEIVEIDGDFNDAVATSERFAKDNRAFLCGDFHYRKEGQKGVIFEIVEQFRYNVPDYVFVQVGNATLISAVYKGLREFRYAKLIDKLPKMVAVQAEGCDPMVKAFKSKEHIEYTEPKTYADAIAVGYPTYGFEGLAALKETDGDAVAVSDKEIETARRMLHSKENIPSEPGGATGLAGFLKLRERNERMFKGKNIVVIVTGNNVHET